ncbi:unnamed protein product [Alopecurus aequalis]
MADDEQPRRRGREVVSGYHAGTGSDTDTDDEDARYYLQSSHDNDQWGSVSAGSARGISPASSHGSDCTISDVDADGIGHAAVVNTAVAREGFSCTVCRREFSSWKAVHGHMRVHALAAKDDKKLAAVLSGAASTVEQVGDSVSMSTAIAVAETPGLDDDKITPVQSVCSNDPVANGGSGGSSARSSMEPSQSDDQSMAIVVATRPSVAPEQVHVAPPPAPLQHVPAAPPQQATIVPPPAPAPKQEPAVLHPPLQRAYNSPLHITVRGDPSTSRRQSPAGNSERGFSCSECDRWFPTHQGLGGHAAGHKNRRIAAAAAAAAAAGIDPQEHMASHGGARPVKLHACKICGAEYSSGVSLGGHMRKHYIGKPIVPRKRLRVGHTELPLALPLQRAPSAMEAPIVAPPLASYEQGRVAPAVEVAAQPPQAPAVPGSLRLFGVTIVQQAKKEEELPVDEPMNEQ